MFADSFLQDVLNRTDIVDLIGRRVDLKKGGKDFSGLCPFHTEKSASFTVSPAKQFYHCFGCGAHGNAFGFLMEYDGMHFVEAVEELARQGGLPIPERNQVSDGDRILDEKKKNILEALAAAKTHFLHNLNSNPEAVLYMKERGLVRDTVLSFGIGFADGSLMKKLSSFSTDVLLDAGLLVLNEDSGEIYDRFRHRVMFPICNEQGAVIGFGGRVITDDAKPKYLNSPETPVFSKGRELFGLNLARTAIRQSRTAVVLEGYMDVTMLRQHGEHRAVAALGTSLTEDQVKRLYRMCDEAVFCFDGDAAGQKAAARAALIVLSVISDGKTAKFLALPSEHDPDSFVREKGIDAWNAAIANESVPLSIQVASVLIAGRDLALPEVKAAVAKEAEDLCATIENAPRFREALSVHLEEMIGLRITKKKFAARKAVSLPQQVNSNAAYVPPLMKIKPDLATYGVYRRLATVCAMNIDDGADAAACGIDPFADLIVSWFASTDDNRSAMAERVRAIHDPMLRGFISGAVEQLGERWALLSAEARTKEQDAARAGLLDEISRVQRVREMTSFLE